jgi:UDP-3-O-[3-hydroxymyristoyl] glucosamine N-acyltransferase
MADPRFFTVSDPISLQDLAEKTGATLVDASHGSHIVDDVAALTSGGEASVSFLDNMKYKDDFKQTQAGACFVRPELADLAPSSCRCLVSPHPYKSYALAAQYFYPFEKPDPLVSPHAVVGEGVKIGAGTSIEAGVVIGKNVEIGEDCHIGANAVISHAVIGDNVRIYPGVCIGQDGFGFAIDPAGHVKVPQLGRVIIGDSVEIGANTTIDRGAGPDTEIGSGTWLDNLVQIGHNVKMGRGCVMVAQSGISGSTVLEDYVVIAGQVGIAGHLRIGMGAQIAAKSGIMKDVAPRSEMMGYPAVPIKQFMRQIATLNRLIKPKKNG